MKEQTSIIEVERKDVAVNAQDQYLNLITVAVEKGADVTQLEKLMDLQDRYEAKQAKKAFYEALSKFQSEIPVIKKKGKASFDHKSGGGNTSYTYAKLEHIVTDIKPYLLNNGLSFRFEQESGGDGSIKITCVVTHALGHSENNSMSAFPDQSGKKNAIQSSASTVTYLQRYTLTGALGVVVQDEDNDGSKDDLGISDELTTYVKQQNQKGIGAGSIIRELEEKYNLMPVTKEHIVKTQLEGRINGMKATLEVNNNEQSVKVAADGYCKEIMDLCRHAALDPKQYLDEVRASMNLAIERING